MDNNSVENNKIYQIKEDLSRKKNKTRQFRSFKIYSRDRENTKIEKNNDI